MRTARIYSLIVLLLAFASVEAWRRSKGVRGHVHKKAVRFAPLVKKKPVIKEALISTGVPVKTDTRGNLGPGSVITQDPPGDDWIKVRDRPTALIFAHLLTSSAPRTDGRQQVIWAAQLSRVSTGWFLSSKIQFGHHG
jgi:hypothetical protein